MTGGFLDTTAVIDLADSDGDKTRVNTYKLYAPLEMPFYALKELLAGHLNYLCIAHNKISSSQKISEALISVHNLNPIMGRKKGAINAAILKALFKIETANPNMPFNKAIESVTDSLALRISDLWESAKDLAGVTKVQPLACINLGEISTGPAGELIGPNKRFSCDPKQRCSAAAHMLLNSTDLDKLIDSLHPRNLSVELKSKQEIISRRTALKELRNEGLKMNKNRCRSLGDAYFVQMCPPNKKIITTNIVDFLPMCQALNKNIV